MSYWDDDQSDPLLRDIRKLPTEPEWDIEEALEAALRRAKEPKRLQEAPEALEESSPPEPTGQQQPQQRKFTRQAPIEPQSDAELKAAFAKRGKQYRKRKRLERLATVEAPKPTWREKLRERTKSEVDTAFTQISKEERTWKAVQAKWKRTKIRRGWLTYKTDWIRDILTTDHHKKSQNFLIKQNLLREVNQYMLDTLDCLQTDALTYVQAEPLVRHNRYGLKKIRVKARVGKKRVDVERVPILIELNVPLIVERINFKRAKEGLRPIGQNVIRNSIYGLERQGLLEKIGNKRGMRGQFRAIGTFYVRQTLVANPYTQEEIKISRTSKACFWGAGQEKIKERLARLEPAFLYVKNRNSSRLKK